jgi:DNA-binding NtrC family response regulator
MKPLEILVVDDQEEITVAIKRYLELHGYIVDTATDPEEALRMYSEKLYKVVFCDVRMPGMSGLELLRQIKSRQPAGIVIMMTAHHDISMVVGCLESGAHDFLVKPIKSLSLLLDLIQDAQAKLSRWMVALHSLSYEPLSKD